MERTIEYIIPNDKVGTDIEHFLKSAGYTSKAITHLKKIKQSIMINEAWVHMSYIPKARDVLCVHIIENEISENIVPVKLDFEIMYEDEDIIVVNKPPHMPVHPSLNNYNNTLGNALAYYYADKGEAFIFRCINRLDKDTTGLTIIAKHFVSAAVLYGAMERRKIHREYLAIVEEDADNLIDDVGTIDIPIGRKNGSCITRTVDTEHGERAVTHYRVLDRDGKTALISLKLETGRTHQIRVHMKYAGHPLVGDDLYNHGNCQINRPALHSYKINFKHPISGKIIDLTAPIPDDMRELLCRMVV